MDEDFLLIVNVFCVYMFGGLNVLKYEFIELVEFGFGEV